MWLGKRDPSLPVAARVDVAPGLRALVVVAALSLLGGGDALAAQNIVLPDTIKISTTQGIQEVSLEGTYIPGVVHSEAGWVPGAWYGVSDSKLQAALEAQAVAARTYLLRYLNSKGADAVVPVGPSFQAFNPNFLEDDAEAAAATAGQVMTYEGEVINANYDSGPWPMDPSGWPYGPSYYGYPYSTWDAMRQAWLQNPSGKLAEFNAMENSFSWTWIFVTINQGLSGDDVHPTVQANTNANHNRGALGQYRSLYLASKGHSYVAILRYFYGADVVIEGEEAGLVTPAPAEPIYALDIAFSDIDKGDAECFADEGFGHVIINTYFGPTVSQLQAAEAGGLEIEAYVPLYWNESAAGSMASQVDAAMDLIDQSGVDVDLLWLDCEVPPTGYSASQIVAKIEAAADACSDIPCGIYTRRTWWDPATAGSSALAGLPLWYALYDGDTDFVDWDYPSAQHHGPYGGWTEPMWKQYAGTTPQGYMPPGYGNLCGVTVDYNVLYQGKGGDGGEDGPAPGWGGGGPGPAPPTPPHISGDMAPDDAEQVSPPWVELSWPEAGADNHEIQVDYGSGVIWIYYWASETQSATASHGLWPEYEETYYRWRVRGHNIYGWGPWSNHAIFYLGEASLPDAPTIFSPEGGEALASGPVQFAWMPVAGAHGYEVQVIDGAGTSMLHTFPEATSQSVPLTEAGLYGFSVRAEGDAGWGPWAKVAIVLVGDSDPGTPVDGKPPAPGGLWPDGGVDEKGDSVTLSCDPLSGATEYEFEIENQAGGWVPYFTYQSAEASKTFWPSIQDTPYRWKVRARNDKGWGPWSSWATFDFGEVDGGGGDDVPEAPTGLDPDGGEKITTDSVTLTCAAVDSATGYEFEIDVMAGEVWDDYFTYDDATPSTTFWPQNPDVAYRWKVRAQNAQGWGLWSSWATFDFGEVDGGGGEDPPGAPSGLEPSGGENVTSASVTLSCDGVAGADEYEFEIDVKTGGTWSDYYTYASATPATTFWPQNADVPYRWKVRAHNGEGWGSWSSWAHFDFGDVDGGGGEDPPDGPGKPAGLSPSGGGAVAAGSVTLSCNPVASATGYEFAIESDTGAGWTAYYTYALVSPTKTFWPAIQAADFRWRARAENAAGFGPWSAWAEFYYP